MQLYLALLDRSIHSLRKRVRCRGLGNLESSSVMAEQEVNAAACCVEAVLAADEDQRDRRLHSMRKNQSIEKLFRYNMPWTVLLGI